MTPRTTTRSCDDPRPRHPPPADVEVAPPRQSPDPPPDEDEDDDDDRRYMMLRHSDDDNDDGGDDDGGGGPHHIPKSPEQPRSPDRGGTGIGVSAPDDPSSMSNDGDDGDGTRSLGREMGRPPLAATTAFAAPSAASTAVPRQEPHHLCTAPSWGSIDIRQVGTFDHHDDGDGGASADHHRGRHASDDDDGSAGEERARRWNSTNVITPAQTMRKTSMTPSYAYPPSSPIKATSTGGNDSSASSEGSQSSSPAASPGMSPAPPRRSSPAVEMEEREDRGSEGGEDDDAAPAEWLPPQSAGLRRRGVDGGGRRDARRALATSARIVHPVRSRVDEASPSRSQGDGASIATAAVGEGYCVSHPQLVRRRPNYGSSGPRFVDASSRSNDSCEGHIHGADAVGLGGRDNYPGNNGRGPSSSSSSSSSSGGRRIQVVGGGNDDEWDHDGGAMMPPWEGIVGHCRSPDSGGGDEERGAPALGASSSEWEPPHPTRQPMVPTPGPLTAGVGGGGEATAYPYPYPNSHYPAWDYYSGRKGCPPPQSMSSSHDGHAGYPASYYPQGRPSSAAYPGPPPQSSYPYATGGYAQYPPSLYPSQYQQHRLSQYPPHHPSYSQPPSPPSPSSHHYRHSHPGVTLPKDENGDQIRGDSYPSLKGYSLDVENVGIRPQFQNIKRGKSSAATNVGTKQGITKRGTTEAVAFFPSSSHGFSASYPACKVEDSPVTNTSEFTPRAPRRRRRRNPSEKAAAAAAMAEAAAAAMRERKKINAAAAAGPIKRENDGDEVAGDGGADHGDGIPHHVERRAGRAGVVTNPFSEEELKTLGSGDDEDIPAAKRAAMASAVALRAAAGGSPVEPPKSALEVDFDIADPPMRPITDPSDVPALENVTLMDENDVLCGRGGGTNSQMGNRRFRALVRDFQPTYLMAKRREKPKMARSVVLIVRHRGGRFLRRDDVDGRLYEVGDEKAEAKTSQALREGLDVRATKTAANTLMGTTIENIIKKRKQSTTSPSLLDNESPTKRAIVRLEGGTAVKDKTATVRPQPVHAPGYGQVSRQYEPPPAAAVGGYYIQYNQQYGDRRYHAGFTPIAAVAAAYDFRSSASQLPPGSSNSPSTMHHHTPQFSVRGDCRYPTSYPEHAGLFPSPPRTSRDAGMGGKEAASSSSDSAAFSPPRSQLVKQLQRTHQRPIHKDYLNE